LKAVFKSICIGRSRSSKTAKSPLQRQRHSPGRTLSDFSQAAELQDDQRKETLIDVCGGISTGSHL